MAFLNKGPAAAFFKAAVAIPIAVEVQSVRAGQSLIVHPPVGLDFPFFHQSGKAKRHCGDETVEDAMSEAFITKCALDPEMAGAETFPSKGHEKQFKKI